MVRSDPKVKETIRAQTPILMRSPNAEAALDVEKIAKSIWRDVQNAHRRAVSA